MSRKGREESEVKNFPSPPLRLLIVMQFDPVLGSNGVRNVPAFQEQCSETPFGAAATFLISPIARPNGTLPA